jgi:hypothetical protein
MLPPDHPNAPKFWRNETSGVLEPAIMAYLGGGPMTESQVMLVRLYVLQWINSPVWNENPAITDYGRAELKALRDQAEAIRTRADLREWFHIALDEGIDPL